MRIGELSHSTGVPTKTIRFYEAQGLLSPPDRSPSGYRAYRPDEIARLLFILKAKGLGLTLKEIRGVLNLADRKAATCSHVSALLDEKLARVETRIRELEELRGDLQRIRDDGQGLIDCGTDGGNICRIIEQHELLFVAVPIERKQSQVGGGPGR